MMTLQFFLESRSVSIRQQNSTLPGIAKFTLHQPSDLGKPGGLRRF
ncbi:hypothetical protein [Roseimaritima multifibrata]|nr:hypothetical protein [Roseimaritima multifibrata]